RRALDYGALVVAQALEARSDQSVDRGRHDHVNAFAGDAPRVTLAAKETLVDQHAHGLADEQRVALRRLEDAYGKRLREVDLAAQPVAERAALPRLERIELDDVRRPPSACQRVPQLAQLGPRERHEQQRSIARPLDEVLDEI